MSSKQSGNKKGMAHKSSNMINASERKKKTIETQSLTMIKFKAKWFGNNNVTTSVSEHFRICPGGREFKNLNLIWIQWFKEIRALIFLRNKCKKPKIFD